VLNPDIDSGPEITSTDEVMLQRPGFRTLLVNGSTAGLRFYPHNTEQAFSDAYTEIANSFNVTLYNAKSENNYAVVWIRDSDLVSIHGYGGNACPFPNNTLYGDKSDIRGLEDHLSYAQFHAFELPHPAKHAHYVGQYSEPGAHRKPFWFRFRWQWL